MSITSGIEGRPAFGGRAHRERGSSIVEVLIASSVAILVLGALMAVVLEGAKEQARGLVEAKLHGDAGLLQDRVTRLLREMSATEGAIYGSPLSGGSPFYRRLIVAQGEASGSPRQELTYDSNSQVLTHDPNRKVNGDERVLHEGSGGIKLRSAYFFPSLKPGGVLDSASVNVRLEMDDDGATGRVNPDGSPLKVSVVRSFTVMMRNP